MHGKRGTDGDVWHYYHACSLQVVRHSVSVCGTRKLLVRLEDGLEVETVVIPNLNGKRCVLRSCSRRIVPDTYTSTQDITNLAEWHAINITWVHFTHGERALVCVYFTPHQNTPWSQDTRKELSVMVGSDRHMTAISLWSPQDRTNPALPNPTLPRSSQKETKRTVNG